MLAEDLGTGLRGWRRSGDRGETRYATCSYTHQLLLIRQPVKWGLPGLNYVLSL